MRRDKILYVMVLSVLCFLMAGRPIKAAEKKEQQITIVQVPQNLNFYLDPDNEKGNGQIYSNRYKVQNSGKEAVTFKIEMSLFLLDTEAAITFCPEEWDEEPEDRSIHMYVMFEGKQIEDKYILTDSEEACKESVLLEPAGQEGDTLYISFGGVLSQSEDWKSGELAINSLYNMSSAGMGYSASVEGKHIRLKNEGEKLASGKKAELYLVPDEGYSLPAKIQVFIGEAEAEVSYDAATGKVFLGNVDHDVVIYANGITRAKLPNTEVMKMDERIWVWEAEEGIESYEYRFLLAEEVVKRGRIGVEDESVSWDWSEGLEDGEYELVLKAIGDAIHCLNSEELSYQITVNRETLQSNEEEQQEPLKPSEGGEQQEAVESSEEGEQQESVKPSEEGEQQEPLKKSEEREQEEDKNQDTSQPAEGKEQQEEQKPSSENQEETHSSEESEVQELMLPPEET